MKKPLIIDPLLQHPHQPLMVNVVEESFNVRIHHPAVAAPMESLTEFQCCALRPFASPVAMRAFQKVLLIYR